jgi:hypothetical protein
MHNIYTLRGALARDALEWPRQINKALYLFGREVVPDLIPRSAALAARHSATLRSRSRWGGTRQSDPSSSLTSRAGAWGCTSGPDESAASACMQHLGQEYGFPTSVMQLWSSAAARTR